MSLMEFSDVDPIAVRETTPVTIDGNPIAWLGPSNRNGAVAVSHRHRYEYDDGEQDYFRKLGGYTYGRTTLKRMQEMGAERIIIREVDNGCLLEFEITQYLSSEFTSETVDALWQRSERDGVNICVPTENALYEWDPDEAAIVAASERGYY